MKWFEITLVILTLFTGLVWLLDKLFLAKRRAAGAGLLDEGEEPVVVDYSKAFFPVLAVVLILRSFVAEPFRIPSNSMMPTLLTGDFILVNKFAYGLRLPITNQKFIDIGEPRRGDVVVFHFPGRSPDDPNKGVDYIKRVIGLPIPYEEIGMYTGKGKGAEMTGSLELRENLPGRPHSVLESSASPFVDPGEGDWEVPQGQYFVMGDNRKNSEDSRYWGFLPESQLRGKAFLIWMSWDGGLEYRRIGTSIH
jgi:signal peptidase I